MPSDLPGIESLTQMINEINQRAQQVANAGRIPGGAGLETTSSGNISNALSGQLDPSVVQQLAQRSAERGTVTGSPSGPGTNSEFLRSLGLTSLDLMNQGQNWLTQATARNPSAPIYNAGNQILTAEQRAQQETEQQRLLLEQQRLNQQANAGGYGGRGGGGNVGGTGGGVTPATRPAINWADLLSSGTGAPFVGGTTNTGTGTSGGWLDDLLWNNASDVSGGGGGTGTFNPSTGNWWDDPFSLDTSGGGGTNWMDDLLWDNASDTGDGGGNYDYNWDEFGGY